MSSGVAAATGVASEATGTGCYFLVFAQLSEKYGTLIERYTALIEKASACITDEAIQANIVAAQYSGFSVPQDASA
eukprot:SAG31_NODE_2935_length_4895_cov_5.362177_4_plen_76_part_00